MNPEIRQKIAKALFHLDNENRAVANRELKEVIDIKVKNIYKAEYEKVKAAFSKEKQ